MVVLGVCFIGVVGFGLLHVLAASRAVAGTSNFGGRASIGSYGGGAGYSVFGLPDENIRTKWIVRMMIKKDDSARAMVVNGLGPHVYADELPGWLVDVKVDPLKYGELSHFDFVKDQCEDVIGEQTEHCVALCKKYEETCPD